MYAEKKAKSSPMRLSAPITQRLERSSLTPVLMLAPLKNEAAVRPIVRMARARNCGREKKERNPPQPRIAKVNSTTR